MNLIDTYAPASQQNASRIVRDVSTARNSRPSADTDPDRDIYHAGSLELFVWRLDSETCGFELFYDVGSANERSLRWTAREGRSFCRVDVGGGDAPAMLPIDGEEPPLGRLLDEFRAFSGGLPSEVRNVVISQLRSRPAAPTPEPAHLDSNPD